MPQLNLGLEGPSPPARPPTPRPVPKAPRYPAWIGDDVRARERYDVSLALAVEAVQEPPTSAAAIMAAQVIFNMPAPTK